MNLRMMTTTQVQRNFGKVLDADEPVVVVRDSQPEKVVVDYEDYIRMVEREEKEKDEEIFRMLKQIHAQNVRIPAKEVVKDVEEALRYVRSRRRH